ncbi:SMP-30/Gluconolaconase/LRE-like region family protein [Rhodococcus sp. MTM3W5.2]|uniref:SMP-30/gluconolactonase/LRE family protein n=1 Tax=Rhodococcus sp. MTM3W5.2 TaxID=1805827 RepID=UPI0009797AD1|nr:SMP-30/gluconolactonase/LRE family protein [Rhodococcus sp. MTM3W5.2]AQA22789.1 SMP-30/Gluconolaconase/LRE-like region family protein [Rhodococcus sp. MTM3W5.2]
MDTLVEGLTFPDGARWHDRHLWFSDTHAGEVLAYDPLTGALNTVAEVPGRPAGLGFLPDGRLLIASTRDLLVLRREPDGTLVVHADLSGVATWYLNEMCVDRFGRAYVGNVGDGSDPPRPPRPADLAMIEPDGTVHDVATAMVLAGGMVVTSDGSTLIVAESRSTPGRLTGFTIEPDGGLEQRRVIAEFDASVHPDGLAIDAEDGVWVASPFGDEVFRVDAEGAITDRLSAPRPYSLALGGPDGRDLFVCTAETWVPEEAERDRAGAVRRVRVRVPAAQE